MEAGELKACTACAKSKRKCGKEFPSCNRCQSRELDCAYPAPHPSGFIFYGAQQEPPQSLVIAATNNIVAPAQLFPRNVETVAQDPPFGSDHAVPSDLWASHLQSAWFLTPESWSVAPLRLTNPRHVSKTDALEYMDQVNRWLSDWVAKGSNPFIHSRLYQTRQPLCIQDAFTALSSYLARTPATEDFILNILGSRAESIIEDSNGAIESDDCYAHLSRVHALLVYTVLRLFGNDIRQRYLAEKQVPVLHTWVREMLSAARCAAGKGHLLLPSSIDGHFGQEIAILVGDVAKQEENFWHAWILSESIRRTWVVAQMVCSIYTTMQQGVVECPGGILFTTRRGVWDAASAFSWTRLCAEKSIGFMRRDEMDRLMMEYKADEVDDFSKALMKLDFGREKIETWVT